MRPTRNANKMGTSKSRILRYELPGEWTVLAGATDEDNDRLSTAVAMPEDWWFHVAHYSGSHVVLRAKPDDEPKRETLRQAAAVAAYHSKARGAGVVQVVCTRARHVRKHRGAKTGTVEVRHDSTFKVRPDIGFARRLANVTL